MNFEMPKTKPVIRKGAFDQLGAIPEADGVNFALFSGSAERVELCLFSSDGATEVARMDLPEYTNEIWHGFVPGLQPGQLYGYRVHGRYAPEEGFRFNPNKLLLDPYARAHHGEISWNSALYGYDTDAEADKDLVISPTDSAPFMPKSVVVDVRPKGRSSRPQLTPWDRTSFYEMHVGGFTKLHPDVPRGRRGTFDGAASNAAIKHIKSLGVTSVELLPIQAFVDDHHLVEKGMRNYWGYNTIGFFTPEGRYLGASGPTSFRDMVRKFHDAGIEVILDVVYNHTAEGNELGSTLSFKGIDNAAYYRLMPDNPRYYINDTGTGNTVNTSHPMVLRMVLDSLRYWTETMEVDGFRFDLGTILGREPTGFDQRSGFFDAMGQDPILSRVKLIGEPWDIGPGGYQVGGFPPGWAEWNDKYRDTVRSYWKGDHGALRDLAARVTGSGDVYDLRGRRPWSSVNFVTAHDGFTLNDLVTYNEKHNEANGEDNNDGSGNNLSYNYGVEGPSDDADLTEIRERQKRNILTTLFISHGTPMLLAGDEFGRTQRGNNNPYCHDDELGWIRWQEIKPRDRALTTFTRRVIALRAENAVFRRASFRDGCSIRWLNPGGGDQQEEHWDDARALTIGAWLQCEVEEGAKEALLLFNAFDGDLDFELPVRDNGAPWKVVLDTSRPEDAEHMFAGQKYPLRSRTLAILF